MGLDLPFGILLGVTAVFLILLVLVQRGRGGGLTGALGGMGGQSAFGSKAGDVFTRVTIVTAAVWILLCVASVRFLGLSNDGLDDGMGNSGGFSERATGEDFGASTGSSEDSAAGPGNAGPDNTNPTGQASGSDPSTSESGSGDP